MEEDKPKVTITLRTIVTGPEAGSIIGRGGEVVNSIRDESGAKIRIEGTSPQERIITVDGPTDSIFKAYTLICKILEEREQRDNRESGRRSGDGDEETDLHLNLLVPSSQCGAIIGKEGVKIKEIRETTGASIHVSSDPLPGNTPPPTTIPNFPPQIHPPLSLAAIPKAPRYHLHDSSPIEFEHCPAHKSSINAMSFAHSSPFPQSTYLSLHPPYSPPDHQAMPLPRILPLSCSGHFPPQFTPITNFNVAFPFYSHTSLPIPMPAPA